MRFCAITGPLHKVNFHIYFSLAHDLIAHGLIVAQINSTQVVMFLEKAQFFSRTNFFFQGILQPIVDYSTRHHNNASIPFAQIHQNHSFCKETSRKEEPHIITTSTC